MKTFLYVDASAVTDPFVQRLLEARADYFDRCARTAVRSAFQFLGRQWTETVHGYETEFEYLLWDLPRALADAPIALVVITDITQDLILEDGIHAPEGLNVRGQVGSAALSGGGRNCSIRVESDGVSGAEALKAARDYFIAVLQGEVTPTTRLTPAPPAG